MKAKYTVSLLLAALISTVAMAQVTSLRGDLEISDNNFESKNNVVSTINAVSKVKMVPKNQERFALNYVNQPPMVPHAVEGYQMNQSNNACLQCHDVDVYRKTGAPRISPTHFFDRDNKMLTDVAPRRYFCLQCHVPQVQGKPLVENYFVPAGKFGQ